MSETQKSPGRAAPPGTPRWVKVFVVILILLVVVFVIMHLLGFGFGGHGMSIPGRYLPSDGATLAIDLADHARMDGYGERMSGRFVSLASAISNRA